MRFDTKELEKFQMRQLNVMKPLEQEKRSFTVYTAVVTATLSVESQMSQIKWVLLETSVH